MEINLTLSPATTVISNYLVVAIYEASSPNTVVDSQSFAPPHVNPRNIVFSNVNPVVHIVKIFENSSSAVGGTIRHEFVYNPSFKNAEVKDDLFLIADQDDSFESGSPGSYLNPALEGWKFSLERRGFGTLDPNVDYELGDNVSFTWRLLATAENSDPNIQPGEVFIMHFQPKITTITPASVSGTSKLFESVEVITATTALDHTIIGKAVHLSGANPFMTITLPDLDSVLANRPLIFMSQGGNHINVTIEAFSGQVIDWLDGNLSELVIGQSEELWLYKWVDPGNTSVYAWRVLHADGNFRTVGEIVHDYYKIAGGNKTERNIAFLDGSLVARAHYKRLWNYVQKYLDSSMLVSDADWNNPALNNKGKFSVGDGVTTFRLPLLYAPGFLKAVDGSARKAGSFEAYQIGEHDHEFDIASTNTPNGLLVYTRSGPTAPTKGKVAKTGGSENSPNNTGIYLSMRI